MTIPVGTVIDRYRIEGLLGEGGFGAVYLARHTMMDRPVALKILHAQQGANPEVLERFIQEARAAAAIGNQHIVQVFDCGVTDDGQPFLAMERLEGEDLEGRLEKGTPPLEWTISIMQQTLEGLSAAHAAGIIHRDMKPANVFLCNTTEGDFVKLLDFGISKVRKPAGMGLTRTGVVMGTPHYMSPELFSGAINAGPPADIYAVGVMMYEALTEKMPHDADTYEKLIVKVATQLPAPLSAIAPHLPPGLTDVVMKCLHKDPEFRYKTAAEVSAALAALNLSAAPLRSSPPAVSMADTMLPSQVAATPHHTAHGATQAPVAQPQHSMIAQGESKKGFPIWIPIVAVLALLVGLGAAYAAFRPDSPQDPTPEDLINTPQADASSPSADASVDAPLVATGPDAEVQSPVSNMTGTTKTQMMSASTKAGRLNDEQKALMAEGKAALKRKDKRAAEKIASKLQRSGAMAQGRYLRGQAACVKKDLGAFKTAERQLNGSQKRKLARYCRSVGFSP